jgi:hypothetical protein
MVQPRDSRRVTHLPELPVELGLEILELTARPFPKRAFNLALESKPCSIIVSTYLLSLSPVGKPFNINLVGLKPLSTKPWSSTSPLRISRLSLRTIDSRSPCFVRKDLVWLYLTSPTMFSHAERILSVCTHESFMLGETGIPHREVSFQSSRRGHRKKAPIQIQGGNIVEGDPSSVHS